MGFFSAVKKFFGQKESEPEKRTVTLAENEPGAEAPEEKLLPDEPMPPDDRALEKAAEELDRMAESREMPAGEALLDLPGEEEKSRAGEAAAPALPEMTEEPGAQAEAQPAEPKPKAAVENDLMLASLREAPPMLSAWLGIVLEGVEEAGPLLWERLAFLLDALAAPEDESRAFISDFRGWLERMEYVSVDEFRSELQYRLALALDLEDEEDERNRLFVKMSEGLAKTREQFGRRLNLLLSGKGELGQDFWDELEELFIMADFGFEPSREMVRRLKERAAKENVREASGARRLLMEELEEIFRQPRRIEAVNRPEVVLMVGVNGAGKTTTIAKLAHRDRMRGRKTLIAAADTFRAAAIEQLEVWAKRVGSDFYAKAPGADPAAVAWEALDRAQSQDVDVLYIDTAGRLQTKVNLMEELKKIKNAIAKKHPGAPHRCVLVLDATTGQNALSQARLFREAVGVDELALTKLDGTAKGGVAIAVAMKEKLPISYVGLGEKMEDLRPFNGADYACALLGETGKGETG